MPSKTYPTLSDFMTHDPCGIDVDLTLADAIDRMLANDIRHLLVVADGKLVGVIDSADVALTNAITNERTAEISVRAAVRSVFVCPRDTPIHHVAQTMERNHYGCAAVVEDGFVVGIFTTTDALRALREVTLAHEVAPEVVASHRPQLAETREKTLPEVRVKRLLKSHGASPRASDGLTFGTLGL